MSCIVIADVMKKITIDHSKYLEGIGCYDLHGNVTILSLEEMIYPNYPDNCWALDVARQASATPFVLVLSLSMGILLTSLLRIDFYL